MFPYTSEFILMLSSGDTIKTTWASSSGSQTCQSRNTTSFPSLWYSTCYFASHLSIRLASRTHSFFHFTFLNNLDFRLFCFLRLISGLHLGTLWGYAGVVSLYGSLWHIYAYILDCDGAFRDPGADQDVTCDPLFSPSSRAKRSEHKAGGVVSNSNVKTKETQATVHKGLG